MPTILSRVGDKKALKRIRFVTVPLELLFIDFTIWKKRDDTKVAFANDKGKDGKQYRLWQLHPVTSFKVYDLITKIREGGDDKPLSISLAGEEIELQRKYVSYIPAEVLEQLQKH